MDPSLEFVITSEDITDSGAPTTLLIFNHEKGFSSKDIDSICSVGRSTKKGNKKCGYIGEKGTLPSFLELQLLWFILKRLFNLSRRLLTILIGFTGKGVRTKITLMTYLFKLNIKIP